MNKIQFAAFVKKICDKLREKNISRNISPIESEELVVQISKDLLNDKRGCEIAYTRGGHAFPDIIYKFKDGAKFGVEVKSSVNINSSNKSMTILGNSILGTTRVDVEEIYIVFIKINKYGTSINYGRYEDCVSSVVVTHSPRYELNLSQKPNESFFVKSGISYRKMNKSKDPIGLVTSYFKKQGKTVWWLAESKPAIIRAWSELSDKEVSKIIAQSFVLFPELIYSKGSLKYKNLSKWLAATYSIVDSSLRDRYSAGGQVILSVDEETFEMLPRVYEVFQRHLDFFKQELEEVSLKTLENYWVSYNGGKDDFNTRLSYWQNEVLFNLAKGKNNDLKINFIDSLLFKIRRPKFF